uniref:Uncharacterized protein n=1 Tax=Fagus sylvatica TaxID=28930 RepID=A0A2N9HRZ4_FAGSY
MSNPKCDTITDTEEARNLKLISNILTEEAIVGPYSRKVWEHFVQSPFLERGFRASREQAAALFNPVRCATPISIARLDQQVIIDKGPCGLVVPPGVSHERRPGFYPPKVRSHRGLVGVGHGMLVVRRHRELVGVGHGVLVVRVRLEHWLGW